MRRHGERRRRLLWAALLLGLVVIVAVLSVVDGGLRIYDRLVSGTRDRRAKPKPLRTARALRRASPA
jgi:hypothetical protein